MKTRLHSSITIGLILALQVLTFVGLGQMHNQNINSYPDQNITPSSSTTTELIYEQRMLTSNFYNQLNQLQNYHFNRPIHSVGIQMAAEVAYFDKWATPFFFAISGVIPQKIHLNDTLSGRLSGYDVQVSIISYNLTSKSSWMELPFGLAARLGRLTMKNEDFKLTQNMHFGPSFYLHPRFIIKKTITLGLRFDYSFDVSNSQWNKVLFAKSGSLLPLDNLRQHAFNCSFTIGFRINYDDI